MALHLSFPSKSHFGQEFGRSVDPGPFGDPYPRHPRGQARAGRYVERGRVGAVPTARLFSYVVPDGSDPLFPVPEVGDRIYVAHWFPGEIFVGGWGSASAFSGLGDLVCEYQESNGTLKRLLFADGSALTPRADWNCFEPSVMNERNPTQIQLDLYFELLEAPLPGEVLKGRMDFTSRH